VTWKESAGASALPDWCKSRYSKAERITKGETRKGKIELRIFDLSVQ